MKAGASLLAVALLCAGCLWEPDVEDCGPGMHYRRDAGCVHSPAAGFSIRMVGTGPYSAMVPYLRLSCLDGDDWMDALFLQDVQNMTVAVHEVEGDEVLWLEGHDASQLHATLPLRGREGCSVGHEERWSDRQEDPDEGLAITVQGGANVTVTSSMGLGECDGGPPVGKHGLTVRVQEFHGEVRDGDGVLGKTFDRSLCQ